ncbi:MAG TPA: dienelactone hydrolase family protein [Solirubrobacteraceae bacterium]|jgi:carboxymethylenebutenolidase
MASIEVEPSPDGVPGAVRDPSRVRGEELTFPSADGTDVNGYLARPADDASHPALIVIHEAGGVGDHIRDVTNRFASIGYVALAVDMYTREGGPPPAGDPEALMERIYSMSDQAALDDLTGAARWLRAREDVTGRLGCIGFCMGGRYTLLFACAREELDAAVDCWGGFIDRSTADERSMPLRPVPPLELAETLSCPLLAAVGAEDHNPSPEIAAQLLERARRSGQEVQVDVYEGAGHAFFADYRPSYRPEPAARLWREIVPFLARHLQEA